jgi:hypothetical protein
MACHTHTRLAPKPPVLQRSYSPNALMPESCPRFPNHALDALMPESCPRRRNDVQKLTRRCKFWFVLQSLALECDHHPASIEVLSDTSFLKPLVLQISPEGGALPGPLQRVVDSIRDIPFDGSISEGPHAVAHRIGLSTRAARWPWIASSMRLEQNLSDVGSLPQLAGVSLQNMWNVWKSVLRTDRRRRARGMHIKDRAALQRIYHLSSHDGVDAKNQVAWCGSNDAIAS